MGKQFPHINENMNDFPKNNERVYEQYDNNFDYSNYIGHYTIFKPCNVRWSANDTNRVWWDSNAERDAWFDHIKTPFYSQDFRSGMNIVDGEPIKLPIPYQAIQQFNYLMVIVPDTPVDNNINSVKRFYYHIINSVYAAPSVSLVTLELDSFTTYQHSVDFSRIYLNRGHYPMTLTTVDTFLSNPMMHTDGLLTKENDSPQLGNIVSAGDFVPLGAGELTLLFAMKADISVIRAWGKANPMASSTSMPTYSDLNTYYGKQDKVDDVRFASAGDYSAVTSPNTIGSSTDNIRPNNYTIIGIRYINAINNSKSLDIFKMLKLYYPQFFNTVAAMYIVPSDLIMFTEQSITLEDYTLYAVQAVQTPKLKNIQFNKNMFDYPVEYENLTKLYTTPYAALRVVDISTNNSAIFDIQQCSNNMTISRKVSIAYPYLQVQLLLSGYGSNSEINYQWRDLTNTINNAYIPESDYNFIKTYDIPTYALYVDAQTMYYLGNYSKDTLKDNAIVAYHNAVEPSNTSSYNSQAMADAIKTNSDNSALTAKDNAFASSDTSNANSNASATTANTNSNINANVMDSNTVLRNTNREDVNDQTNLRQNQILKHRNDFNDTMHTKNKNTNFEVTTANNDLIDYMTARAKDVNKASAQAKWQMGTFSMGTAGANALMGSFTAIAGSGNPVLGAGASIVGGLTQIGSALTAGAINEEMADFMNLIATSQAIGRKNYNDTILDAQNKLIDATYDATVTMTGDVFTTGVTLSEEIVDYNNDTDTKVTTNNSNALRTTSANTMNTTVANSARTNTTVHNNGQRTYNTTIDNNIRSNIVTKENSIRVQDISIRIAKRNLELALKNNEARKNDEARKAPIEVCTSTGSPLTDIYKTNGLLVQLIKQPNDIIKKCGDIFLQYGYTYNHVVENPNFILHKYFDFWQGDMLVYSIDAPHHAVESIRALFAEGLTVWSSGDIIGHSIYDNPVK